MLDIAWPELLVIGAVALVAIGPKDLPRVMHSLGKMAGKAKRMMHDLQNSFEQLNYEAEVAERLKRGEKDGPKMEPLKPVPTGEEEDVDVKRDGVG